MVLLAQLGEFHSGYVMTALKNASVIQTKALRNGEFRSIPALELVKGDVVRIRQGDVIPADVKLLHGDPIQVDQSSLTGETLPLFKYSGDEAYSGSMCTRGEIEAVVFATGKNTLYSRLVTRESQQQKTSTFDPVCGCFFLFFCSPNHFLLTFSLSQQGYFSHWPHFNLPDPLLGGL